MCVCAVCECVLCVAYSCVVERGMLNGGEAKSAAGLFLCVLCMCVCCVLLGMDLIVHLVWSSCSQGFKDGDVRFLICTDVAARGIDISGLPFVINMTRECVCVFEGVYHCSFVCMCQFV